VYPAVMTAGGPAPSPAWAATAPNIGRRSRRRRSATPPSRRCGWWFGEAARPPACRLPAPRAHGPACGCTWPMAAGADGYRALARFLTDQGTVAVRTGPLPGWAEAGHRRLPDTPGNGRGRLGRAAEVSAGLTTENDPYTRQRRDGGRHPACVYPPQTRGAGPRPREDRAGQRRCSPGITRPGRFGQGWP